MAMFGRKKPMYQGMDPEYSARNIPIGQAPVSGTIPMGQMQPQSQEERFKPNILGVIGDAMQVFGGGQATYMQGMQAEQQRAQMLRDRAAQQQQQRQAQREDMQWEWENKPKEAPNNDTANDLALYESWTPEQRRLYHQMKPTIAFRGDGTPISVNPYDLQGFEKAPEGVTFTPFEGGSAGNGTGGFR